MLHIFAVGVGGFVGAIARHALTGIMHKKFPGFLPGGTLLVNALGCLTIGILMTLASERQLLSDTAHRLLITGFLGSLTTFSAFGWETVELIREDEMRLAFWNVAANLGAGFGAVWLGRVLVNMVSGEG